MADQPKTHQAEFGLGHYESEQGRIIVRAPSFDFDTFPELGERLVGLLSAQVVEKQWDADIHSWLIDFEGCKIMLRAEHYSESVWLESLAIDESKEEFDYLANLFQRGF